MKVWMIWMRDTLDRYTWLETAWTDDMTAENHPGWEDAVAMARKMVHENPGYEMRIQAVNVPGIMELFEIPEVDATS